MVSRKEWYQRVNAVFPKDLPKPTPEQAVNAARRLYRWMKGHKWTGPVELTSGNRYTWIRRGVFYVNPDCRGEGWSELVHDLSHYFWNGKLHAKGHAKLELRMRKEVLKRGWLNPEQVKEAPPEVDVKAQRYERIKARIKTWEAKERRAKNAIRKLNRQAGYYERSLDKPG
jgi:hypothetical protein